MNPKNKECVMAWPKDTLDRFEVVTDNFTMEVEAVRDWDARTPVPEWVARDIILHLREWYPAQVCNAGVELQLGVDTYEDPAGAWKELARVAYAALREHPELEKVTRQFFIGDVFMHTWDLARSQGRTPVMDEDAAAASLAGFKAMDTPPGFGEPHPVSDDAPIVEQLMAYIGRDPNFSIS